MVINISQKFDIFIMPYKRKKKIISKLIYNISEKQYIII